MKRNLFATAAMLVSLIFSGDAFATTYYIDSSFTTTDATHQKTLEALRTSLTNSTLAPGDEIVLYNNDNTLTRPFTVAAGTTGGTVTIRSNDVANPHTISSASYVPNPGAGATSYNFIQATGTGALTIDLSGTVIKNFASTTNNTYGAGISTVANSNIKVSGDVVFDGCETGYWSLNPYFSGSDWAGGAVSVSSNSTLQFTDSATFQNGNAGYGSGIWLSTNAKVIFDKDTTFINNRSFSTGSAFSTGALSGNYGSSGNETATFNSTVSFIGNRAARRWEQQIFGAVGSAIGTSSGTYTFKGQATFDDNASWFMPTPDVTSADYRYYIMGAIGVIGAGKFDFNDGAKFTDNTAIARPGTLTPNVVAAGGAISILRATQSALPNVAFSIKAGSNSNVFSGNVAEGYGGAIFADRSDFTITGKTLFSDNYATLQGGAVSAQRSNFSLNLGGTDPDNSDDMAFTGNLAGVKVTNAATLNILTMEHTASQTLRSRLVLDKSEAYANDLWLEGVAASINTANASNIVSMDGGIRAYNYVPTTGAATVSSLTKTGAGTLAMVGNSWSAVDGTTTISGGTFHLGKDSLWGKDGTTLAAARASTVGVGTFTAAAGTTLSFEFNRGAIGEQWGGGHSVIFADKITIDNDTQVALVYYDDSGTLVDGSKNNQNIQWQTDRVYDLAVASTEMNVAVGLNRGAYGEGDAQYLRDLRYDRDASGNVVFDGALLSYGIEAFNMSDVIGSDPPYYDPSLKNRILARRLGWMPRCPKTECGTGDEPDCCGAVTRGNAQRKPQWNAWLEGYGTGGNVRANAGMPGLEYSAGGMLGGFERQMSRNSRFGIYYGYGNSWMTGDSISYQGKGENTFGVYLRASDRWGYTLASANLGWNNYRVTRTLQGANLDEFRAKFSATTDGAYLERGFDKKISTSTILTPFGALQYAHLGSDWFEETSTTANDLRQTAEIQYESLRSLIGARTQTLMYDRLVWQNSIHWEHELLKRNGVSRNDFLTDDPTMRAQTIGNYGGRDWCVYGTGLEFEITSNLTLNAGYDLSFNKNSVFHTGMAGVTYKF